MRNAKVYGHHLNWLPRFTRCTVLFSLLVLFACASAIHAQAPSPAAAGPAEKSQEGFTPGWGFGVKFEGSSSGDGTITDLATGVGYNFSRHFGVDLGVPYYFVGTPSSVKQKNPSAVSGNGLGSFGADLKWNFPGKTLNYDSTLHLGAPTGDTKKGLSTGHATWNWSNHIEHGWGNFTPYIEGGVGNTVPDTHHFKRPFMTFGYNLALEAGTAVDAGPLSLSASAYYVAPWGPQTIISRVFRCSSGTKCSATGKTTNRKNYLQSSVSTGDASLARDNGFNASVEIKPWKTVDLEFDYSRSIPLRLNIFSFGISLDIGSLLRSRLGH